MSTIVLVTRNLGKFREIRKLMPDSYNLLDLANMGCEQEISETGTTFSENALIKARYVHDQYKINSLADDSGLEVDALNGEPGVFSARFAGEGATDEMNVQKLLDKMRGQSNRKARFKCVLALILDGEEHLFDGSVEGQIALKAGGSGGFGYDPVFIPDGYDLTFAELPAELKNAISHRAKALKKLLDFMESRGKS